MALKTCRTCKETKPIEEFGKNPTGTFGVRGTCKVCRASNRERTRGYNIKSKYGITLEELVIMYNNQDGCCSICDKEMDLYNECAKRADIANIDHCHETGKIRALLCNHCNTGLGKFMDDPELLLKAADYLNYYRDKIVAVDLEGNK
jgi:hypothetical protein